MIPDRVHRFRVPVTSRKSQEYCRFGTVRRNRSFDRKFCAVVIRLTEWYWEELYWVKGADSIL
jgi:hypothetical protein